MLNEFKSSLKDLEYSFSKKANIVREVSHSLENNLLKIKDNLSKNDVNNEEIKGLLPLIEKLSIQNEYKLSIIKEFPKYILNKK